MSPWDRVREALEAIPDGDQTESDRFWICDCDESPMWEKSVRACWHCGRCRDDVRPASLKETLLREIAFASPKSWTGGPT